MADDPFNLKGGWDSNAGAGTAVDTESKLRNQVLAQLVVQITALVSALTSTASGTFTLGAAASTVVTQPLVMSTSDITLTPTNAAAATLMGSAKSLYISARTSGTSFTVATANAAAAAGTETFLYVLKN